MLKEVNFCGIYLSPFFLYIAITGVLFVPVHWYGNRIELQKFVWNRPVFEVALFVIVLSVVAFIL